LLEPSRQSNFATNVTRLKFFPMPKVVSRNVVTIAPDEVEELDPVSRPLPIATSALTRVLTWPPLVSQSKKLHLLYCLCGEFQLVLPGPLSALPIRPLDGARALRNSGPNKKTYKLTAQPIGDKSNGVLVRRGDELEYQREFGAGRASARLGLGLGLGKVAGLTPQAG